MKHFRPEPDRYQRQGFPEAIFCPGKTVQHIVDIADELLGGNGPVIATRADKAIFRALKKRFPGSVFHEPARLVHVRKSKAGITAPAAPSERFFCVVTAGTSDIPAAEEAAVTAEILGSTVRRIYDVGVAGVHRLLGHQDDLLNASCVVVCAGMEGALTSVVGGLVRCPVIGVPTSVGYGVSFHGVSALLSMLNSCAPNVSAVNIDDGFGAGVIASLINRGPGQR